MSSAPATDVVSVVIADDNEALRAALTEMLALHPRIEIVATAHDGPSALDAVVRHRPDVAVLDVRMPGMTGTEVATRIAADAPGTAVLLLSAYSPEILGSSIPQSAQVSFLGKDTRPATIARTVLQLADGDAGS